MSRAHPRWGALFVIAAAVGFSAKALFAKLAYAQGVDAITVLMLRMTLSLPFFLALMRWPRQAAQSTALNKRDLLAAALLGLLGYHLSSVLDFYGLLSISVGLERLILFLYPTLVLVISALFLGHSVGWRQWLALALSYSGIALAFAADWRSGEADDVLRGGLMVFGAALVYASYILGSSTYVQRLGAARFTAYAMLSASLGIAVQFFSSRPLSLLIEQPPSVWALLSGMAIIGTVMPSILLSEGLKRIGPSRTALLSSAGPVATLGLGHWLLGETISSQQLVGAALVIAGVALVTVWAEK